MELLPFIDSVSPKIRPQKLDESYADYTDHLRAVVVDALLGEKVEVPYQINFNTSPLWLLKKILEQEVNVQTVTDAEILIQSMRTLRKGMAQMKAIEEMNRLKKLETKQNKNKSVYSLIYINKAKIW